MESTRKTRTCSYLFDDVVLDCANLRMDKGGQPRKITPRAFEVLVYLAEHHGRIVEKQELFDQVWKERFVTDNALTRVIKEIRRAIGDDADAPRYVETVPKRGYRFIAEVKLGATKSAFVFEEQSQEEGANRPIRKSLAVIPFTQWGAHSGDEYLGLGIADALITKLSNIKGILLRPTSSIHKYTDQRLNSMEIGRELSVESVLEGSIHRSGDRLRVTVQLVRVQDGSSLWASKFDVKFTDIFAVQDSTSEQVAESLVPKLTGTEREAVVKRHTENIEAYQLHMKGRYHWNKHTPEAVKKSIHYFQQATEKDPSYALAFAGLSDCYVSLPFNSDVPPREAFPKAKRAAARALELDDRLAEAQVSMGSISFWFDWDWQKAESHFKRAIDLNPNYPMARFYYACLLSDIGRFEGAAIEARRALELDPLSLLFNSIMGQFLFEARHYDRAIEQLHKTLEIEPNFWIAHVVLGKVYVQKRMYGEALTELRKALEFSGGNTEASSLMGYTYAVSGDRKQAEKVLDELEELSRQKYVAAYNVAMIYAGLGETNQALDWLEKAYDERGVHMTFLKVVSHWDGIRKEPRFTSLLQRVGF